MKKGKRIRDKGFTTGQKVFAGIFVLAVLGVVGVMIQSSVKNSYEDIDISNLEGELATWPGGSGIYCYENSNNLKECNKCCLDIYNSCLDSCWFRYLSWCSYTCGVAHFHCTTICEQANRNHCWSPYADCIIIP